MTIDLLIQQKRMYIALCLKKGDENSKRLASETQKEVLYLQEIKKTYEDQINQWKKLANDTMRILKEKEHPEENTTKSDILPDVSIIRPAV